MPLIFVILDGMTEGAVQQDTPFVPQGCGTMARLAREGGWGTLDNTPPGLPVDSLTCIATLLGVPPEQIPTGRAYLEALSAGISVGEGDAVCRCNLTALDETGALAGAYHALPSDEARALCKALSGDGMELLHLGGYKNLLIIQGGASEAAGVLAKPPHQHPGEAAGAVLPTGNALAQRLCDLALRSRFLHRKTGCMLFPWDISVKRELPRFAALHGKSAVCVCKTEIVRGLCAAMELPTVTPPGATAEADTDLAAKARVALEHVARCDIVFVHVNGADELGHRKDAAGKAAFLRRVDAELLAPLAAGLPQGARLLLCSDHGTAARTGGHIGGAQPLILYERGGAARGYLGAYPGTQAVTLLSGQK